MVAGHGLHARYVLGEELLLGGIASLVVDQQVQVIVLVDE